jgi:hypothetical protein
MFMESRSRLNQMVATQVVQIDLCCLWGTLQQLSMTLDGIDQQMGGCLVQAES